MSLSATSERALVLCFKPSNESFYKIDILNRDSGHILCLQRIAKKSLSHTKPDIFDTADILLDPPRKGTVRFIREYHIVQRRSNIGKSYRKLQYASEFCSLIIQNAPYFADPGIIHTVTERALNAFAERGSPEIIFLKALYILLKGEGYPVRESWWPQLPTHLRETARQFIKMPTPESTSTELIETCTQIVQNLRHWLSYETDLMLPNK